MNHFIALLMLFLFTSCGEESYDSCIQKQNKFKILEIDNVEYSAKLIVEKRLILDSLPYNVKFNPISNQTTYYYKSQFQFSDSLQNFIASGLKYDSSYSFWYGNNFLAVSAPYDTFWVNDEINNYEIYPYLDSLKYKDRIELYSYKYLKDHKIIFKSTYYTKELIAILFGFPVSDTTWTARNKTECEPYVQLVDLKFKDNSE